MNNEMEQLKRQNAAMRRCCVLAAKLSTQQGYPQENHAVVVAAMDALSDPTGSDLVTREEHERAVESARAMTALNLFGPELDQLREHIAVFEKDLFETREQLAAAARRAERAEAKVAFYRSKQVMVQISKDLDSERLQQENTQLRADKEKAEAACAAKDKVLRTLDFLGGLGFEMHEHIRHALSSDCGKDYVKKTP